MRKINNLQLKPGIFRALKQNTCLAQEPVSMCNATKLVVEILESKYDKAGHPSIAKDNYAHLSPSHCKFLRALLLKLRSSLIACSETGDWKLPPVTFKLKEGAKPYHGRLHPIPKIHKASLMKEINCLISIGGVLKWQPSSQWASPSFIIQKKDHTVCTKSDFRGLNEQIVRKPYHT
jgi:hypothetical protein